jgi:2-polyprenyl-3-methyl-5-hydroxy-6-metoxy-1,4-benzoquinol methylase
MNALWSRLTALKGPVEFRDRVSKALMIEAILEDFLRAPVSGFRILDIGCGNGGISRHFAAKNKVHGVDTKDRRGTQAEPYEFTQVTSEILPFADRSFDIVVSHHVIEHVPDQRRHLAEIARVLSDDGVCYLATPNRSSPFMQGHRWLRCSRTAASRCTSTAPRS